ncbi:unnamed protein product, partial [Meganyctiphanes norvegica]
MALTKFTIINIYSEISKDLCMFSHLDIWHHYNNVVLCMRIYNKKRGKWLIHGYDSEVLIYPRSFYGREHKLLTSGLTVQHLPACTLRRLPQLHNITRDHYCEKNLEIGYVCVSLLGTWSGKGTEVWTSQSNLLQVIISIQGLILVSEPYFNEAGYERQKGTQQGRENSRMYNEMVLLKLIQAMSKVINGPPDIFKQEIIHHFHKMGPSLVQRLECWLEISENHNSCHPLSPTTPNTFREFHVTAIIQKKVELPEFPLIPASKGFCITLRKTLQSFKQVLQSVGVSN